ncbi:MAG: hypothetical protein GY789_30390 [Hyphomicrobiales bacterium]|nr:hypothetical protein [Hyphomicrobiales bacterium]
MNLTIDAATDEPALPPVLNGVCVEEPFETAKDRARQRKTEAGDLFWSRDEHVANLAIVLAPEVDRSRAAEMVPLSMVALCDCLAVLLPPQVAVQTRECGKITVNVGEIGDVRAAISKSRDEVTPPDWMVLGITLCLSRKETDPEPGFQPDLTSLDEEGCNDCSCNRFIETYARHFLSWLAIWEDEGFRPVERAWKFKAEDEMDPDMNRILRELVTFESAV